MAETDEELAGKARDLAGKAWDQATRGIAGVEGALGSFRARFIEAITDGKPGAMADLEDEVADQLAGADWQWPWFDEWYARFNEWRMWPTRWPSLRPADDGTNYSPDDLAEYRRAAIASLIVPTAAMIFFRDRHMAKSEAGQKWRLAFAGDPSEMRAAEAFRDRIASGDISVLPPFFPGDKTRVQVDAPVGPEHDKRPAGGS